jgi:hypothetical protein
MKLKKSIAISEDGFVFNAGRGESFSTNGIGTRILNLLQEGKDQEAIQGFILNEYDIDAGTCEKDIYDFIKMLVQYSLVD